MTNGETSKSRTLVADRVFDQLLARIITGELAGGAPLRIRDIAEQVGTSVMPVREAIRRLTEIGLAVRAPHRGAVVSTFTVSELIQAYDVRALLESEAAMAGVPNVTADVIDQMWAGLERMREAVSSGQISQALDEDEELHRLVYVAGGNEVILEMVEALWLRCRPYKYLGASRDLERGDTRVWNTQEPFIEAVSAGYPRTAAGIIVDSLQGAQRRLESRL